MLCPVFLSHGAPTLPFEDVAAKAFLMNMAGSMKTPTAILIVSAHWETQLPTVNSVLVNETIHDFRGFPQELYEISYPAPGSVAMAQRVVELLEAGGQPVAVDRQRGLDHGAWVPLMLSWPNADIPIVQLSVQTHLGPAHHLAIGRILAPLTEEGVLIIGSGSYTHDLSSWRGQAGEEEPSWVTSFADWFSRALKQGNETDLINYRTLAPNAVRNHPTEEHLLPLFVAFGAASPNPEVELLHTSQTYGVLRMDAFAFGRKAETMAV
jgi:4,5-DOPA dioxygenase extradiol